MKISLILGRGVEGTGVTNLTTQIARQMVIMGYDVQLIIPSHKIKDHSRKKAITFSDVPHIIYFDDIDWIRYSSDVLLIMSVPDIKIDDIHKDRFNDILDRFSCKKVYTQLDHSTMSINRNYYATPKYINFFDKIDMVITHTLNNPFSKKWIKENNISTPIKTIGQDIIAVDMNDIREKYFLPFNKRTPKTIGWIGRFTTWKGPMYWLDFYGKNLINDWACWMQGIEMSIASVGKLKFKKDGGGYYHHHLTDFSQHHTVAHGDKLRITDISQWVSKEKMLLLGPYKQENGYQNAGRSKFMSFTTWISEDCNGPFENTLLEVAALSIPILREDLKKVKINGFTLDLINSDFIFNDAAGLQRIKYLEENEAEWLRVHKSIYNTLYTLFNATATTEKIIKAIK